MLQWMCLLILTFLSDHYPALSPPMHRGGAIELLLMGILTCCMLSIEVLRKKNPRSKWILKSPTLKFKKGNCEKCLMFIERAQFPYITLHSPFLRKPEDLTWKSSYPRWQLQSVIRFSSWLHLPRLACFLTDGLLELFLIAQSYCRKKLWVSITGKQAWRVSCSTNEEGISFTSNSWWPALQISYYSFMEVSHLKCKFLPILLPHLVVFPLKYPWSFWGTIHSGFTVISQLAKAVPCTSSGESSWVLLNSPSLPKTSGFHGRGRKRQNKG